MPKPACVPCQRFYRPMKNGAFVTESMPITNPAKPGTEEPHKWKPYKVWQADLWICLGCGHQLIAGYGVSPRSEKHESDFAELSKWAEGIVINDC